MRVLVINHSGDVRDAYHRLRQGGPETYYAQRYSVSSYASLLEYAREVSVLARVTKEAYDEVLPNGVRAVGCGPTGADGLRVLIERVNELDPTHVVLGTPDRRLIQWLTLQRYHCLSAFSGSIPNAEQRSLRRLVTRARNAMIAFCLNQRCFDWVGSYGLGSCRKLVEAGVDPRKVIPWDFLLERDSGTLPVKALRAAPADGFSLCYVGSIQPEKGVGDLIECVALLKSEHFPVRATIVGSDAAGYAEALVRRYGVENEVDLVGLVPNDRIELMMHRSDVVVVPSRPEYPEGFPLVIHHALRARTPLVASTHPMFRAHLRHGRDALLFPAGNARALADTVHALLTDPERYAELSARSDLAWRRLRLDVKWADLVRRWLRRAPEDQAWLAQHTLAGRQKPVVASTDA